MDDVAALIADLLDDYKPNTVRNVLVPLSGMLRHAVRKGLIATNPISLLESDERPPRDQAALRVLTDDEIVALLDACDCVHLPLVAAAVALGARQGELLGLVWREFDFATDRVEIRRQLDRKTRQRVKTKTAGAMREVKMEPSFARLMRAHKLRSRFSGPDDFVSETGTPMHHRNVTRRGLAPAVEAAGLNVGDAGKISFHNLRHTYACVRIAEGWDVTRLCDEIGHASPSITLDVYGNKRFRRVREDGPREGLLEAVLARALDGKNMESGAPGLERTGADVLASLGGLSASGGA